MSASVSTISFFFKKNLHGVPPIDIGNADQRVLLFDQLDTLFRELHSVTWTLLYCFKDGPDFLIADVLVLVGRLFKFRIGVGGLARDRWVGSPGGLPELLNLVDQYAGPTGGFSAWCLPAVVVSLLAQRLCSWQHYRVSTCLYCDEDWE